MAGISEKLARITQWRMYPGLLGRRLPDEPGVQEEGKEELSGPVAQFGRMLASGDSFPVIQPARRLLRRGWLASHTLIPIVHDHARVAPHHHHPAVHHKNSQGRRARQPKCARTRALTHHPCGVGGAVHLEGSSRVRKGRYKNLLKV